MGRWTEMMGRLGARRSRSVASTAAVTPGRPAAHLLALSIGAVLGASAACGGDEATPAEATTSQAATRDGFGFNYWPERFGSEALSAGNWSRVKGPIAADLDHMRSLGARVVRLNFWPLVSGFGVMDLVDRAIAKNIPYALHWMLWDHAPDTPVPESDRSAQNFGMGYSPHAPKDVLGSLASRFGLVPNPDMETIASGRPTGWWAGGSVPIEFFASGVSPTDSATHSHYFRVQTGSTCSSPSCVVWAQSGLFPVTGGTRLYLNGYVRSNMSGVRMNVVQYDGNSNRLADISGPAFTPSGWSWNNYLQRVGSWSAVLAPDARKVIVAITGTPATPPAYLDVDAVSASQ